MGQSAYLLNSGTLGDKLGRSGVSALVLSCCITGSEAVAGLGDAAAGVCGSVNQCLFGSRR